MMPGSSEIMGESSAPGLSEDFSRAADDFAAMQQEHRAALVAGNLKDLFSWGYGRERAFRRLAVILERVVACGQENKGCVASAREKMGKLLAEEEVLRELILARQLKMQEQLLAMRKGKEALQGYNMNKRLVPQPKYLSSRT